jgi:hypothetical protein
MKRTQSVSEKRDGAMLHISVNCFETLEKITLGSVIKTTCLRHLYNQRHAHLNTYSLASAAAKREPPTAIIFLPKSQNTKKKSFKWSQFHGTA